MPATLRGFYTSGLYAWGSRGMRALSVLAGSEPAISVHSSLSVVANVESSLRDVFKAPIDKDVAGKEVAVCPFELQTKNRRKSLAHRYRGR